jgi:epoxyqueuosine reductase
MSQGKRRSAVRVRRVEKPPYTYDPAKISRYDQRNLIFNRVGNDPRWSGYMRSEEKVGLRNIAKRKPGYTRVDYALAEAAWTVHECFQDAWSWERIERPLGPSLMGTKWYQTRYRVRDPVEMTKNVKKAAKLYGASLVGVAAYNPLWMQINKRHDLTPLEMPEGVKYVVVGAIEMDELAIATSPEAPAGAATGTGYSRMAFVSATLAEFIRNLGYTAIPAGNNVGLSVPIAIDAGLGQLGRHGLLITPELGPRVRLLKVFTDLPLVPDKPIDFGVTQFCRGCKMCAEACEVDAISFKDEPDWEPATRSSSPGAMKWYMDAEKCFEYWCDNGMDCSTCISVCPYTKGRPDARSDEFWASQ